MKNKYVRIALKTDQGFQEYTLVGQFDEEKEQLFLEELDPLKTKMILFLKEQKIVRETQDYRLTLLFDSEKETMAKLELNGQGQLELKLKTDTYDYQPSSLIVKYQLLDSKETIEYKITFER